MDHYPLSCLSHQVWHKAVYWDPCCSSSISMTYPNLLIAVKFFLFADNTKCSYDIRDPESFSFMQPDINNLLNWSKKWKLHFNESKCVLLQFRLSTESPPKSYFFIGEHPIQTKDSHTDLGVIMQTNLKCNSHYDSICTMAYRTLYLLNRTFSPRTDQKEVVYILG